MRSSPASLPLATRATLALVAPGDVARDGAADQLLVLGAATAAGLRVVASRLGPGRVLIELRQLPEFTLDWHAREVERHLGPSWGVRALSRHHLRAWRRA